MDYRKKSGTLILTSLLEDLDVGPRGHVLGRGARLEAIALFFFWGTPDCWSSKFDDSTSCRRTH